MTTMVANEKGIASSNSKNFRDSAAILYRLQHALRGRIVAAHGAGRGRGRRALREQVRRCDRTSGARLSGNGGGVGTLRRGQGLDPQHQAVYVAHDHRLARLKRS